MAHDNTSGTAPDDGAPIPFSRQLPVYATGFFSNGSVMLANVIVPLWVLTIDPSPVMVGIALAARQSLPVLLSIHGGALMDRIGIRRVMLWFACMGAVAPFLFPMFPSFGAVIVLQALTGVASAMGWIGTQAQIGAIMKGEPRYAGRVTFFNRFAILAGPPATGLAWDLGGAWGGFGFLGFWGIGLLLASLALPKPREGELGAGTEPLSQLRLMDVLPRPSDYVSAFRLMAIPAIAFVVYVTVLRHASNGMLGSFYVVYLESIGMTGTLIGVLIAAGSVLGGIGSLTAGWFAKRFTSYWVLVIAVSLAITCIAITPVVTTFVLLLVLSALRGGFMGLSQPLLISIMAQSAGKAQGKGVGLRTTANRLAILITPVIMGAVAEVLGIHASFYVTGLILLAMMLYVALRARSVLGPGSGT
jgi:MFS family permease